MGCGRGWSVADPGERYYEIDRRAASDPFTLLRVGGTHSVVASGFSDIEGVAFDPLTGVHGNGPICLNNIPRFLSGIGAGRYPKRKGRRQSFTAEFLSQPE